jgi:hypothetical protein
VVTWDSEGQDGDYSGIFAQCFTAAGVRFGSEFQVNSFTTSAQYRSDVAMNAAGEFVVTWEDYQRRRTWAQRYASGCTPVGGEFQAHSGEFGQVGIDSVGNFVVAATAPDADYFGVWAQRFSDSGVALGAEFLVNSYVTGSQESQDVAMAPNGDFVVVWQTYNYLTSEFDELSARAFRADGTPVAPEVTVNSSTAGPQTSPSVGIAGDGRFVVAWRTSLDGTDYDIAARRFRSPDVIFADGFE